MTKVFIIAPAGVATGGPELSHQLADSLNRETERAWMLYEPFGHHETPEPYRRYNVAPALLDDIEADSIVIVPEIYTKLIDKLPTTNVYFWWQSVDNFFIHAGFTIPGKLGGKRWVAAAQIAKLKRLGARHLYQSDYARVFLESKSLGPVARISDYLADEYIQELKRPRDTVRDDLLVYNPKKGAERTQKVLDALRKSDRPMPEVVPLIDMTRQQVCDHLARAKVYIDFGGHPGKDRIPREAVALGACVVVNRRGSAGNPVDVPIPDIFKVDDREPGFATIAAERIRAIMGDFEGHHVEFHRYREKIAAEPAEFLDDVKTLFGAS